MVIRAALLSEVALARDEVFEATAKQMLPRRKAELNSSRYKSWSDQFEMKSQVGDS
jgi:hypothetical protein